MTLVEYADLQCPYCADWAVGALPVLVDEYVRSGKLRIVFRGLAFLGAESDTALRTAVAAGRQNKLWDVVHALYERQGAENSGWVTESLLAEVAPGVDVDERHADWVSKEIERSAAAARAAGLSGTPAFQVGRTGGRLRLVEVRVVRGCGAPAGDRRGSRRVSERLLRAGAVVARRCRGGAAGYLLYVRVTDSALACSTGGCETVQRSAYAELLGFPVAGLGLAAFLVPARCSRRSRRARPPRSRRPSL